MNAVTHKDAAANAASAASMGYLIFVSVAAALGGLLFGYDTAVISGAVEALREHFVLDPLQLGWVVGCTLVGCMIGVLLAGKLTDWFGRRAVLCVAALLFFLAGLGSYAAPSVTELVAARIVGGIGVGFASLLVPVYIAELAPPRYRGALVSLNQMAILLGMVLAYLFNAWVGRMGDEAWLIERGWRLMLGAQGIPAIIFFVLSLVIPESPRWLVKRGKVAGARAVLQRLHGNVMAERELAEISTAVAHEQASVSELFKGAKRRGVVIMAMVLALFQAITGINIVMYYAPTIFTSAGVATGAALSHSVIIGLVMLVFTAVSMWLVDRAGRRPIMLLASAGMGISLALLGLMFAGNAGDGGWLLLWILTYVSSFSIGMGGIYWVVVSEIFPTRVRGAAASLSVVFLWGGNYLVSQFFPAMLASLGGHVFYFYALMCLLCFVFVLTYVPETKGKTLEQIEGELFGVHG